MQSLSASDVINHPGGEEEGRKNLTDVWFSFVPWNRSLRAPFLCLGSSWVNPVNDISLFGEPGFTCIQFKGSRNAPSISWGEIKWLKKKSGYVWVAFVISLFQHVEWPLTQVEWTWIFSFSKLSCGQLVKKLHVLVLMAASVWQHFAPFIQVTVLRTGECSVRLLA